MSSARFIACLELLGKPDEEQDAIEEALVVHPENGDVLAGIVLGVDKKRVLVARSSRNKFWPWCAQLPQGCLVAMEVCGGAHH
jgi:hypothetical protein